MPPRPRRQIPALPTEVLYTIIRQALPPVHEVTYQERCHLLLTFLTVNKEWAVLAQRELHRAVKLGTPAVAAAFLKRASGGRPDEVADAARMESLQIGSYINSQALFPILDILLVCPKLAELHIVNCCRVDPAVVSVSVGKVL